MSDNQVKLGWLGTGADESPSLAAGYKEFAGHRFRMAECPVPIEEGGARTTVGRREQGQGTSLCTFSKRSIIDILIADGGSPTFPCPATQANGEDEFVHPNTGHPPHVAWTWRMDEGLTRPTPRERQSMIADCSDIVKGRAPRPTEKWTEKPRTYGTTKSGYKEFWD